MRRLPTRTWALGVAANNSTGNQSPPLSSPREAYQALVVLLPGLWVPLPGFFRPLGVLSSPRKAYQALVVLLPVSWVPLPGFFRPLGWLFFHPSQCDCTFAIVLRRFSGRCPYAPPYSCPCRRPRRNTTWNLTPGSCGRLSHPTERFGGSMAQAGKKPATDGSDETLPRRHLDTEIWSQQRRKA